tara:strand:- start:5381 stop:5650 length:270 start_codon:yes stop_codon:yes gene_type:complete
MSIPCCCTWCDKPISNDGIAMFCSKQCEKEHDKHYAEMIEFDKVWTHEKLCALDEGISSPKMNKKLDERQEIVERLRKTEPKKKGGRRQ